MSLQVSHLQLSADMLNDFAFGAGMKVGVSADAPLIFTFPLSLTIDDPLHSTGEDRIISAGDATKKERND